MNMTIIEAMNRLKYTLLTLFLTAATLFAGCNDDKIPDDVIGEEKMTEFMQDAYLLEGYFAVETEHMYDTLHPEMIASYDSLFTSYAISREEFEHSLEWYTRHPAVLQRVHDSILARFDRQLTISPSE